MKPPKQKASLTFAVRDFGSFLFTRSKGITARNDLEDKLRNFGAVTLLTIDFTGVDAMTNSFTDEFLGKFYLSLAAGDSVADGVELDGLNEETRDAVTVCLERRKQIAVDAATHELLGDAAVLADTYQRARELGEFRASALSEALQISLPNANNRLKRLVEAGALRRERSTALERGGKEFTYAVPQAGDDA
jgi:hypothetical protein